MHKFLNWNLCNLFYKNLLTKCKKCGIIKGWGGKPRDNGRNERFFQFVKYFHILFTKNSHLPIPLDFPETQHAEPRPPSLICKFLTLPAALERTSRFFQLLPVFRTFLPHNAPEARFAICPKMTSPAAHAHNPRHTKPKSHMQAFET